MMRAMVEITVESIGRLRTRATHGPSRVVACTAAPADNMGDGSSFSPTDLLATSLATCVLTTMEIAASKHGIALTGARARVEKHMTTEGPRRVARLPLVVELPPGIPPEMRERLENAGNACPVKRSLHPDVEAPIEYRWG
jgi:putative redox protein